MTIAPGTRLGRYEIRSQLGEGGMGEVFLAQDTQLRRLVALKVLPPDLTQSKNRLSRFEQEAFAASALNHPNIVTIHEVGKTDSFHYIVTEYVEGESLRQYMRGAPVKVGRLLDISIQIASALSAAHAAGIIHRDIKPENVMLRRDDIAKVLDFGLAKLVLDQTADVDTEAATRALVSTSAGVVMGTTSYMSPEQARGIEVDARTDIWSLGVLLYEMVSGRVPFAGTTATEVIARIIEREPAPLTQCSSEVPAELERIVAKALAKDVEERYQTAKDLTIDLKKLKQRLEVESEIERTAPPESRSSAAASTQSKQTAFVTGQGATGTSQVGAAQTTSSAEYLVNEIKRHKLVALLAFLAIGAAAIGLWSYLHAGSPEVAIDSIAVLPLVNTSSDPNTEYLSDGISEALINSLTELQQLRVIARSTAFRYKGKEVDPQAVGRDLNVRAVLMGRVRQLGDALNIQVDLVDVTTGAQLWGQEYERQASDVLAVKQDIAREVTEKLRLRLSGEDQRRLIRRDTTNAEAYQFFLRGRYFWNKRTADGMEKAIEQFQQAIDRDPNYALGYVGLADCYVLLEYYAGVPASETLPKARVAADRALQIDDSLAEAHTSSALTYHYLWRWVEAEEEHKRAISLNPNYPTAHHWFSQYFRAKRQFDDSMREIKRAQELDPLSPIISANVVEVYILKNDLNSAVEQCKKIIELDPSFPHAYSLLGWAYFKQRRYEEATAEFQKAVELSGRASLYLSDLGYCYAVTGRRSEALRILKDLEKTYARREATGQHLARMYAGLGDKDQAFAWLERDFQQRSGTLPYITWWFNFEDLRSDPRYADLVRRMGLQP